MYLDSARLDALRQFDPQMADLVEGEERRQTNTLCLIASENYPSPVVSCLEGSIFASKNAEGYPGKRVAGGCEAADAVERLAVERCKELFGCEHANVQSMSATVANVAVLSALLKPGDTILGMELNHGGHLSHGARFHLSGKSYKSVFYGLNRETERIDMDEVERLAKEHRPNLIICGASSYPRLIDYKRFGQIAHEVGAYLLADIAHPVGLIAAGLVPSPVPYADVVTTSTHKTWRGPRGCGIIMCKRELASRIDQSVFPGLQGAPKIDMIASRAVQMKESMTEIFKDYQRQVLKNAAVLADELTRRGVRLVSGGTDTHLVLADVRSLISTGSRAEQVLGSVGLVANKNLIPFDPLPARQTSGIRLGSPALTTRGFVEDDFRLVAGLIVDTLERHQDAAALESVRGEVSRLAARFPLFSDKWSVGTSRK